MVYLIQFIRPRALTRAHSHATGGSAQVAIGYFRELPVLRSFPAFSVLRIGLAKGHQPAGKRIGSQGQAQGLSQEAKDAMARILPRAAAAQA